MKKIIVSIITIGFLFTTSIISITAFGIDNQQQSGQQLQFNAIPYANIYVDGKNTQGPWDGTYEHPYQHIQDGINEAEDSDIVYVFSGTYNESVIIDKAITLRGEDRDNTTIDGGENDYVVRLNANDIKIIGFTIQNGSSSSYWGPSGIYVSSDWNIIVGNTITNIKGEGEAGGAAGITIYNSSNNLIKDNRITNIQSYMGEYGKNGIHIIYYSSFNTIIGNTIEDISNDGGQTNGIYVEEKSYNNVIKENTVKNMYSQYLAGINLDLYVYNNIVSRNTITSLSGEWVTGIQVRYSSNNTVLENTITSLSGDYATGIDVYRPSSNNTVRGNTITSLSGSVGSVGIEMDYHTSNNTIEGNTITDSNEGINLLRASNNTISGNTIDESNIGIFCTESNNNTISENTISNCRIVLLDPEKISGRAIVLFESTGNLITNNTFINNARDATFIFDYFLAEGESYEEGKIPDGFDKSKIESNIWYQNYWERPRVLPKEIVGELDVYNYEGIPLYSVTLYNYDQDPLLNLYGNSQSNNQKSENSQQSTTGSTTTSSKFGSTTTSTSASVTTTSTVTSIATTSKSTSLPTSK